MENLFLQSSLEQGAQTPNQGITKKVIAKELRVERLMKTAYQKDKTITAELKQEFITTATYPKQRVGNSLEKSIFGQTDFGFKDDVYTNTETRVAWIHIPENVTQKELEEKLKKEFPKAHLYKILSNKPILSDEDKYAIENPEIESKTLEGTAEKQVLKYPIGTEKSGSVVSLQVIPFEDKPQYKRVCFDPTGESESVVDKRDSNPENFYSTESIDLAMEKKVALINERDQRVLEEQEIQIEDAVYTSETISQGEQKF